MNYYTRVVCLVFYIAFTLLTGCHHSNPISSEGQKAFSVLADETLHKGTRIFDEPGLYDIYKKETAAAEFLVERWYPEDSLGSHMVKTVKNTLGPQFVSLLLDPGIACRFKEFMAFAKTLPSNLDPFVLRTKFSEHLGTRIIYRGVGLSTSQADSIRLRKEALVSPFLQTHKGNNRALKTQLQNLFHNASTPDKIVPMASSPLEEVNHRRLESGGEGFRSAYMSVTGFHDLAASMAQLYGDKAVQSGGKAYVIKAKVPVISLIENKNVFEVKFLDPEIAAEAQNATLNIYKIKSDIERKLVLEPSPGSHFNEKFYILESEKNLFSSFYFLKTYYVNGQPAAEMEGLSPMNPYALKDGYPVHLFGGLGSEHLEKVLQARFLDIETEMFMPYLVSNNEIEEVEEINIPYIRDMEIPLH